MDICVLFSFPPSLLPVLSSLILFYYLLLALSLNLQEGRFFLTLRHEAVNLCLMSSSRRFGQTFASGTFRFCFDCLADFPADFSGGYAR